MSGCWDIQLLIFWGRLPLEVVFHWRLSLFLAFLDAWASLVSIASLTQLLGHSVVSVCLTQTQIAAILVFILRIQHWNIYNINIWIIYRVLYSTCLTWSTSRAYWWWWPWQSPWRTWACAQQSTASTRPAWRRWCLQATARLDWCGGWGACRGMWTKIPVSEKVLKSANRKSIDLTASISNHSSR